MTVSEAIQTHTEILVRAGVESPRLQTELLLAHVLGLPRLGLFQEPARALTAAELEQFLALVGRRGAREPLQHIWGSVSFCGLELQVSPAVLIPRPETELLAERAWDFLSSLAGAPRPRALDFGTGSGCVAIALAVHAPAACVWASDISVPALAVAQTNARRHPTLCPIQFVAMDNLAAWDSVPTFDLIVSNPPYIPGNAIAALEPEVRDHDPRLALDGGPDGLDFYRRLAAEAVPLLRPAGRLMLEIGDGQSPLLLELFARAGWRTVALVPDLTRRPRILDLAAGAHRGAL